MEDKNDNQKDIKDVNLSHEELNERLENYSKIGNQKEQFFAIQRLREKYNREIRESQEKRAKTDIYYAQGVRSGLPQASYEKIKEQREQEDQKRRNEILKEAKQYYSKHNSLTRDFDKSKEEEMERER